jgi:pimeloyl-ACP methyl ester carboxylesterase
MSTSTYPAHLTAPRASHTEAVARIHERMLRGSRARPWYLRLASGSRVHVIETGGGPPAVLLHGSTTSSLSHLPLLDRVRGFRAIAVDRPGFGLSDPAPLPRDRYREATVEWIDEVLDALELPAVSLVGSSMGGTWATWYALARPERVQRLVLLGATPLLPATRAPAPIRLMAAPALGGLLRRVAKPNAAMVVRLMSSMGEGETITRHPDLIEALVATGRDPIASATNLAELQAIIAPTGFRSSARIRPEDLRQIPAPTLMVWGDHDPVGSVEAAASIAGMLPDARLEIVSAGHVPWLGEADVVADLMSGFLGAGHLVRSIS